MNAIQLLKLITFPIEIDINEEFTIEITSSLDSHGRVLINLSHSEGIMKYSGWHKLDGVVDIIINPKEYIQ